MSDPIELLMNNHDWYSLETPLDHLRAWLWCISNFLTFLSYFAIPNEIRYWRKAFPLSFFNAFAFLFISFIALCGASHMAMLIIMPTSPWWPLLIYVPMAVVSVATVVALVVKRNLIIGALSALYEWYNAYVR